MNDNGNLWYAWACPGPYNGDSCTKAEGAYEFHNPPGKGVEAPEWTIG
jgi:hypothetical protein